MRYFTAEEARRVIANSGIELCLASGPNAEAFAVLMEEGNDRFSIASAFLLGRATGIREERARRARRL